jgi:hypothetical protein
LRPLSPTVFSSSTPSRILGPMLPPRPTPPRQTPTPSLHSHPWAPLTSQYGVASALKHSPKVTQKAVEHGFECASHGSRWIQHGTITPEEEAEQIR